MNPHMIMVKGLCKAFQRREVERGGYGKGVKRDNAAIEFFVGAANAVEITHGKDSAEFKGLVSWITLLLATRGYKAIAEEVD